MTLIYIDMLSETASPWDPDTGADPSCVWSTQGILAGIRSKDAMTVEEFNGKLCSCGLAPLTKENVNNGTWTAWEGTEDIPTEDNCRYDYTFCGDAHGNPFPCDSPSATRIYDVSVWLKKAALTDLDPKDLP